MGQQLSSLSDRIRADLTSTVDSSSEYRSSLRQLLRQYQSDASLSAPQILQWSGEKLVADLTDETHPIGIIFLERLSRCDLGNFDAPTVTQCIAQAAMHYLEELSLDMSFHVRYLDCAAKGSVEKLKKIETFIDANYQNEAGSTALMIACHGNHISFVHHLLTVMRVDPNMQDALGWTALMFCARDGHEELVTLLLNEQLRTDIDRTANNGITALMCAADAGHYRIVQALMEKGADVNACTNAGDTALLHSCHAGHSHIVRLLLAANVDVNVTGKHLCSPALLSARFGSYDILAQLVAAGADVSAQDDEGRTVCDFEYEGQVAAAIQRGIVARFNRGIIKPTYTWRKDTTETNSSSTSSPSILNTPHPRLHANVMQGSVSTVSDDSPSSVLSATGVQISSRSRTPSPGVPVRKRKSSHAATTLTSQLHSSSSSHSLAAQARPIISASSSSLSTSTTAHRVPELPSSRSKAFVHPNFGDALTDEALADLEAGVEQLLHRRQPVAQHEQQQSPALNVMPHQHQPNSSAPSIVRSPPSVLSTSQPSRTTTASTSTAAHHPLARASSDNVHQYEDDAENDDAPAHFASIPRRQARSTKPATDEIDEQDLASEDDDGENEEEDTSISTSHASRVIRPLRIHRRSLSTPDGANYMASLDAHLLAPSHDSDGTSSSPPASPLQQLTGSPQLLSEDASRKLTVSADPPSIVASSHPTDHAFNGSLPDAAASTLSYAEVVQRSRPVTPEPEPQLDSTTASSTSVPLNTVAVVNDDAVSAPATATEVKPDDPKVTERLLVASPPAVDESVLSAPSSVAASPVLSTSAHSPFIQPSVASPLSDPMSLPKRRPRKKKLVDITAAPSRPLDLGRFGSVPAMASPSASTTASSILPAITSALHSVLTPSPKMSPANAAFSSQSSPSRSSPHAVEVNTWLSSSGFDAASRNALAGFTFTDLYALELNDCIELVGEVFGPKLYGKLKQRVKEGHRRKESGSNITNTNTTNIMPSLSLPTAVQTQHTTTTAPGVIERRATMQPFAPTYIEPVRVIQAETEVLNISPSPRQSTTRRSSLPAASTPSPRLTATRSPSILSLQTATRTQQLSSPSAPVATMPIASPINAQPSVPSSSNKPFAAMPISTIQPSSASIQSVRAQIARSSANSAALASAAGSPPPSSSTSTATVPPSSFRRYPSPPPLHAHTRTESTGFYTKDLINSQTKWLAQSFESMKHKLAGTSTREVMREQQPHRVLRGGSKRKEEQADEEAREREEERIRLMKMKQQQHQPSQQHSRSTSAFNNDYLNSF